MELKIIKKQVKIWEIWQKIKESFPQGVENFTPVVTVAFPPKCVKIFEKLAKKCKNTLAFLKELM